MELSIDGNRVLSAIGGFGLGITSVTYVTGQELLTGTVLFGLVLGLSFLAE